MSVGTGKGELVWKFRCDCIGSSHMIVGFQALIKSNFLSQLSRQLKTVTFFLNFAVISWKSFPRFFKDIRKPLKQFQNWYTVNEIFIVTAVFLSAFHSVIEFPHLPSGKISKIKVSLCVLSYLATIFQILVILQVLFFYN